jgi:uncharacterized protein (TIGR03437 family)
MYVRVTPIILSAALASIASSLLAQGINPIPLSVNTAYGSNEISQNVWIEIKGRGLVPQTPAGGVFWSNAPEFASGMMPTSLNDVSVTVGGVPAYIWWYCSTAGTNCTGNGNDQINVLVPLTAITGSTSVVIKNGTRSGSIGATLRPASPAFLLLDAAGHITAQHSDGKLLGPTNLYPGISTPALPGETIVLYAVGFGLPGVPLVQGSVNQSGPLATLPTCVMDGVRQITTVGAYVISPGLYQVNVTIPVGTPPGDHLFACTYGSTVTNADRVTLLAVGPISPASGFVPGSTLQITGNLSLNGKALAVQMTVVAQGFGLYSVTFDDKASAASGVTMDLFMLQTTPAISGNTFSITGPTSNSHYQDTSAGPQPVTTLSPVRANLYFDAFENGSSVTGIYTFTNGSAGVLRGTFKGTVASIQKPAQ